MDVAATMLDALEAPALPNAAGRSFLSQIDGGSAAAAWEDLAFSEYCTDKFGPPEGAYQRMVRREEWKYIYYHEMPPQLFNLKEDPEEAGRPFRGPRLPVGPAGASQRGPAGLGPRAR